MSWLIYSLIALTTFVIYEIASRYLATKSANPRVFSTIFNFLIGLMAPLVFLLDPTKPQPLTLPIVAMALVGVVTWGIFARFEYFAHANVSASTLAIVLKLAPVLNFILAILLLHEQPTSIKFIGVLLILAANGLLFFNTSRNQLLKDKGIKYAVIISVILAFAWLFDAINIKPIGLGTYTVISYLGGSIICGLFPRISLTDIKKELSLTPLWQIAVLSATNLIGFTSMLKALSLAPATSVMPVVTSTSPFVVLFGYLILKEKDYPLRKFFAAMLSVLAIYLMR